LDIGTGGGFPAIPLKVIFPGLNVLMIERSEKKLAFLQKAVVTLALEKASVIHGSFPDAVPVCQPDLITARAIDAPERLLAQVLALLPERGVFLCQIPRAKLDVPATFHVERIHDTWTERQLRRGDLHLISHA
jgi:16S rRNA (guanine527-N7)-methyltransferase